VNQLDDDPVIEDAEQDGNDGEGNPIEPAHMRLDGMREHEVYFPDSEVRSLGHSVAGP
jgi:hypothetical protein